MTHRRPSFAFLALLGAACGGPKLVIQHERPLTPIEVRAAHLRVAATLPRSAVRVGEPVLVDVEVVNGSEGHSPADVLTIPVALDNPLFGFRFEISDLDGGAYPFVGPTREPLVSGMRATLPPGYWIGRRIRIDLDYAISRPGTYRLFAVISAGTSQIRSSEVEFTVE